MINLIYYRHNEQEKHAELNKTKINFNELTIVLKGQLNYTVNDEKLSIFAGDVIFIKKDSVRQREMANNTDYYSFNFLSEEDFNLPLILKGGANDLVHQIINVFDSIYKYTSNLSDERFTLLLSCIIKQLQVQRVIELEPPLVNQIKNYIRGNLDKKITLNEISRHAHYSISHCEMVFNKTTGLSITNYLIKKRIEKAKSLLVERNLSLIEVAETVGFNDYNHFSRIFKKETGISPLTYRKTYFS